MKPFANQRSWDCNYRRWCAEPGVLYRSACSAGQRAFGWGRAVHLCGWRTTGSITLHLPLRRRSAGNYSCLKLLDITRQLLSCRMKNFLPATRAKNVYVQQATGNGQKLSAAVSGATGRGQGRHAGIYDGGAAGAEVVLIKPWLFVGHLSLSNA